MKQIPHLVRKLRQVHFFKISVWLLIMMLMILGAWVATDTLEFPAGPSVNDKIIHVFVFFSFSVLMDLASSRKPFWIWKGIPLLGYGIFIEILQYFAPYRTFSVADMFADFVGIFFYSLCKLLFLFVVSPNLKSQ